MRRLQRRLRDAAASAAAFTASEAQTAFREALETNEFGLRDVLPSTAARKSGGRTLIDSGEYANSMRGKASGPSVRITPEGQRDGMDMGTLSAILENGSRNVPAIPHLMQYRNKMANILRSRLQMEVARATRNS